MTHRWEGVKQPLVVRFPRRLVMKRICNVKPGDLIVGRDGWKTMQSVREVVSVRRSRRQPGKFTLVYSLPERGEQGVMRRWPNFYIICVKL